MNKDSFYAAFELLNEMFSKIDSIDAIDFFIGKPNIEKMVDDMEDTRKIYRIITIIILCICLIILGVKYFWVH